MVDLSECGSAKVTPLFQEKLCVMTSPLQPLANKEEVYLKDFINQSFTFTYSECCFTEHFRNLLLDADIALKSELFLGSVTADCIMTSKQVQPQDELYPIIEASKNYCLKLKKDSKTKDIVLL